MNRRWTAERIKTELEARSTQDIAAVVLVTTLCSLLAIHFEWTERFFAWTRQWESLELDELAFVFLVLALGLAWFSLRRWREARTDLVLRLKRELPAFSEADSLVSQIESRMRALQDGTAAQSLDANLREAIADTLKCTDRLSTLMRLGATEAGPDA